MMMAENPVVLGSLQPRGFPLLPEGWTSEWETFLNFDGTGQLFAMKHHEEPWQGKRTLVVIHGLGEHGGRYLHFPYYLRDNVDSVYTIDMRGHGRSEGLRGHIDRFDSFASDVAMAIRRLDESLKERFGRSEIHLYGHSCGGLITLRTILLHRDLPIRSVTVSAPLLKIAVELPLSKRVGAQVLSRLWGSVHLKTEVNPGNLSHDRAVQEAYLADRLVHAKGTPRFYTELLGAMNDTLKRDTGFSYPLQFVVPLQDKNVDPETTLDYFKRIKHRDKRLKTYPGFFHEPHNEIGKEKVLEDIAGWIEIHRQQ